jgi:NAD(P)H-hydrate epimerase
MAEADRVAIEEFNIRLLQMMEHAGTALAWAVMRHAPTGTVSVLAGGGNNGAGGMCAARHLVNRGRNVEVVIGTERLGSAAEHHLTSLVRMGVPVVDAPGGDVAVDALVGYGLHGPLTGRAAELARWTSRHPTICLDLPSGIGFTEAAEPTVTVTLAAPKIELRHVRPLYLADIGWPGELWRALGVEPVPLFAHGPISTVAP